MSYPKLERRISKEVRDWYEIAISGQLVRKNFMQALLGMSYINGDKGVPINFKKAKEWFELAVKDDSLLSSDLPEMLWAYGQAYCGLYTVNKMRKKFDKRVLIGFLFKAQKSEIPQTYLNLGLEMIAGKLVRKDSSGAIDMIIKALEAEKKDKSFSLAHDWVREESEKRTPEALFILGANQVQQGKKEGINLLKQSASNGIVKAMHYLGNCYRDGVCVDPDINEAIKWYESGSFEDDVLCQSCLGLLFDEGKLVDQDIELAIRYYEKAAKNNEVNSMLLLYSCIREIARGDLNTLQIAEYSEKATKWLTKAARLGNEIAIEKSEKLDSLAKSQLNLS